MGKETSEWFIRADKKVVQIFKVISYVALASLFAIMVIAVVDVIGEQLSKLNVPVSGVPYYSDWIAYLHVPVVFFASGFVTLERGHTCVDILTNRLNALARKFTEYFSMIVGICISAFLAYRGFFVLLPDVITHGTTISSTSYAFPQWPFTLAYCIGTLLLALSFVWALLRLIFRYKPEMPEEMSEDKNVVLEGEGADQL